MPTRLDIPTFAKELVRTAEVPPIRPWHGRRLLPAKQIYRPSGQVPGFSLAAAQISRSSKLGPSCKEPAFGKRLARRYLIRGPTPCSVPRMPGTGPNIPCANPSSYPHLSARSAAGSLHKGPAFPSGSPLVFFIKCPRRSQGLSRSECDLEWVAKRGGAQDPRPPEIQWDRGDRVSEGVLRTGPTAFAQSPTE